MKTKDYNKLADWQHHNKLIAKELLTKNWFPYKQALFYYAPSVNISPERMRIHCQLLSCTPLEEPSPDIVILNNLRYYNCNLSPELISDIQKNTLYVVSHTQIPMPIYQYTGGLKCLLRTENKPVLQNILKKVTRKLYPKQYYKHFGEFYLRGRRLYFYIDNQLINICLNNNIQFYQYELLDIERNYNIDKIRNYNSLYKYHKTILEQCLY